MNAITALNFLKDIPEKDFIIIKFTNNKSKCCAIGHLSRLTSKDPSNFSYFNCILQENSSLENFVRNEVTSFTRKMDLADVNNLPSLEYPQDTPKKRVIALLFDMVHSSPDEAIIQYPKLSYWQLFLYRVKNLLNII